VLPGTVAVPTSCRAAVAAGAGDGTTFFGFDDERFVPSNSCTPLRSAGESLPPLPLFRVVMRFILSDICYGAGPRKSSGMRETEQDAAGEEGGHSLQSPSAEHGGKRHLRRTAHRTARTSARSNVARRAMPSPAPLPASSALPASPAPHSPPASAPPSAHPRPSPRTDPRAGGSILRHSLPATQSCP